MLPVRGLGHMGRQVSVSQGLRVFWLVRKASCFYCYPFGCSLLNHRTLPFVALFNCQTGGCVSRVQAFSWQCLLNRTLAMLHDRCCLDGSSWSVCCYLLRCLWLCTGAVEQCKVLGVPSLSETSEALRLKALEQTWQPRIPAAAEICCAKNRLWCNIFAACCWWTGVSRMNLSSLQQGYADVMRWIQDSMVCVKRAYRAMTGPPCRSSCWRPMSPCLNLKLSQQECCEERLE